MSFLDKAKEFVHQHDKQVDQALDKLGDEVDRRTGHKYRDRTYRYGLIEAGHLGQNAYLTATSAGLGACAVGAFLDDDVRSLGGAGSHRAAPRSGGRFRPPVAL